MKHLQNILLIVHSILVIVLKLLYINSVSQDVN